MSNIKKYFDGKVAIVTGGTRGIGKTIVNQLAQQGCHVIYTGTKNKSKEQIPSCEYWPLDLSDEKSIELFLKKLEKEKRIDILVNNAGINIIEAVDEIDDAHWAKILKVNLTGAMKLMKVVSRIMKKNKQGGKILNISSIFGIVSRSKRNAYSATKAGLIGLTRASALDLAPYNILVNALCPGFTNTELTASILSEKDKSALVRQIPLRRFAETSEIVNPALFLCSDLNTYITGQTVIVDGGFTAI